MGNGVFYYAELVPGMGVSVGGGILRFKEYPSLHEDLSKNLQMMESEEPQPQKTIETKKTVSHGGIPYPQTRGGKTPDRHIPNRGRFKN